MSTASIAKLANATNIAAVLDVNAMASTIAKALRRTTAHTFPRRWKHPRSEEYSESSHELRNAPKRRGRSGERVWDRLPANAERFECNNALKVAEKAFKRVEDAELQTFVHELTVRTWSLLARRARQVCTNASSP